MVLAPYFSKNACALCTCCCLKKRESGRVNNAGPDLAPEEIADLITDDRGSDDAHHHDRQARQPVVAGVGRQESGDEQQRVAGQEETDQKTRFGEDDQRQECKAPLLDDRLRFEEVDERK